MNNTSNEKRLHHLSRALKRACDRRAYLILAIFVISQPLLSIAEYWFYGTSYSTAVTASRALLLIVLLLSGLAITTKRRLYIIFISSILLFMAARLIAIYFMSGIDDVYSDLVRYYRAESLFLVLLPAVTLINKIKGGADYVLKLMSIAFVTTAMSVAAAHLTGTGSYAYESMEIGIVGWFGGNSYGVMLLIMLTASQLYFYIKNRPWFFVWSSALGYLLLYAAGTRVAFYSVLAVGFMWAVLMLVNKFGKASHYVAHLALVVLAVALAPQSPMSMRQGNVSSANNVHAESSSPNKSSQARDGGEALRSKYETYAPQLLDRFGYDSTLEAFDYSGDIGVIRDYRVQKNAYSRMLMGESSIGHLLLGHEVSNFTHGSRAFQPEDDMTSILVYYGALGAVLYWLSLVGPILYTGLLIARRGLLGLLNPVWAVPLSVAGLVVAAGVLGGSVLFVQSVSVYMALFLAFYYSSLFHLEVVGVSRKQ